MAALRFEWDPGKDAENQRKHGISFEEPGPPLLMSMHSYSTIRTTPPPRIGSFCSG